MCVVFVLISLSIRGLGVLFECLRSRNLWCFGSLVCFRFELRSFVISMMVVLVRSDVYKLRRV